MSNTIRFSGLASGMDTESIVKAILAPYQAKIDNLNKKSTLAEWKKDAMKEMSLKLLNFKDKTLSKIKSADSFKKSKVTLSKEGSIIIDTSATTTDGMHKVQVNQVAEAAVVKVTTIKSASGTTLTKDSLVSEIGGMPESGSFTINGVTIDFNKDTTIEQLETVANERLMAANESVNFKFDASSGAFLINSNTTGKDQKITLEDGGTGVLSAMGIQASGTDGGGASIYEYTGKNAEITYNGGISLTSATNDIEINGLKFTALAKSDEPITVSVSKDIDAMVDSIKSFIEDYNTLLGDINTKLNADSAKNYQPLTKEEKEAMSDKEVELWEEKIKTSLFRRDSTLSDIATMLRGAAYNDYSNSETTESGELIADQSCSLLSQIGIGASSWTEKGKLTIKDEKVLREALAENSEGVGKLINTIATRMDKELRERSASVVDLRSYNQFFNDKVITKDISNYAKELISAQARYDKLENTYYKKFAAMESAINKMNSQSSLFSSL